MSHKLIPPTEQEDKAITQAALNDPDSAPLSDEELAAMHFGKGRGPQKHPTKVPVSIRLTPDVVDYFKASGKGWQTKINTVLKDYVHSHA